MKTYFLILIILILSLTQRHLIAQTPSNDDCSGSIVILSQTNLYIPCIQIVGDVNGATNSGVPVSPSCSNSNPNDDVWFSFVATCIRESIEVTGSASFHPAFEVFSGSCDSLVSILCVAPGGSTGSHVGGQATCIEGQTYYMRVYDYNAGYPATTSFTICIINNSPTNDNSILSNSLYPNSSTVCENGDVCGATQSFNTGIGTNPAFDVWYDFLTSTAQDEYIVSVIGSSGFNPVFQISYGVVQGPYWTVIGNGNGDTASISLTGLADGHHYYIRVWDYTGYPSTSTFTLCVKDSLLTNINELNSLKSHLTISPNPFSITSTLKTNEYLEDATLTIYNSFGQQVKQIKNISGQLITLHRDNLQNGIYFLRLTQLNKTLTTDKLVIIDD